MLQEFFVFNVYQWKKKKKEWPCYPSLQHFF